MKIPDLIERFRDRPDLTVEESAECWIVEIRKGSLRCAITIPKSVFEWFVSVSDVTEEKEIWSDWMDHYDDSPELLEVEMTDAIVRFVERALLSDLASSIPVWKEESNQSVQTRPTSRPV